MAENVDRNRGRPAGYKFDKGGAPTDFGPYIGTVMNNVDPTRSGRLQVYIEQFAGGDKTSPTSWRTVSYVPPFYGITPHSGTSDGTGTYPGNQASYGFWGTPPDLGVQVICIFVAGDPNQGYYIGCVPEPGMNQMIPAIGGASEYATQNEHQGAYFANSKVLPVTEINSSPESTAISDNPKFFDQKKPVHSYVAAILFQQGLNNDLVRGPISSSSQRESPSQVYGWSTPGRPIYQGGSDDKTTKSKVKDGSVKATDAAVIGRRGGHSIVMDDGDLSGASNLVRIRTSKGHQITMSDDADCFYITHANGQTWLEFGVEGTVDVFSTNSVNIRTQGTINLHADKDINMFAGGQINMKSTESTTMQSDGDFTCANKGSLSLYSEAKIGVKSNGTLALQGSRASINGGSSLSLKAARIDLNGGATIPVATPKGLTIQTMPDTTFNNSTGWEVVPDKLESIVTRAPTHEPWPYHNKGVQASVSLGEGQPTPPPGAPAMPSGYSITQK